MSSLTSKGFNNDDTWWSQLLCTELQKNKPLIFFVCLFCLFVFQDRVCLCSPSCPGTRFVDQAGLELRILPASASQVLGLKACTIIAWQISYILTVIFLVPMPLTFVEDF